MNARLFITLFNSFHEIYSKVHVPQLCSDLFMISGHTDSSVHSISYAQEIELLVWWLHYIRVVISANCYRKPVVTVGHDNFQTVLLIN